MALAAGSCAVASDGTVSGTGLAKAIADAHTAAFAAVSMPPDVIAKLMSSGYTAAFSNSLAAAIVNHITANAAVTVTIHTTDTGLQTSTAVASPTGGPASNKTITGTVA